ncbi:unnamed protein product [Durusdinium trenchii]|uniref:C2 domain-containing protein n=1 Tax=Durusdinium trenchii TaxID=1381693 RepID=A0ABP0KU46_9DINO
MSWTQDPREDREASSASPSRGFGRWFSDLASAGREVKRVAKETRDAMVLLRHSAKHGDQQARPAEGLSQSLRVEVLSASDLSYVKSLPVPYCVVVTGYPDQTWGKKLGRECKTAPALRQRHPRWNALCHVAFPPEQVSASRVDFQKPDAAAPSADPPELCVRVLDAGGLRGDRLCGEARVPLRGRRGAGTFRLLGGGYATVSLRWSDRRGEIQLTEVSPEDEAFERACAFWARHDLGDLAGVTHAQLELAAMLATEPNGSRSAQLQMNEIILQAPLSALLLNHLDPREIQGLEVQSPGSHSLMTVLSEHLHLFTPLAGSRLVGALVERLPMVRGSVTLEDPCYLVVQRCAEAWEDFLLKIFLHFRGKELLELKRLVDAAGGGRDLRNTVYTVITHEARRAALLKHFEEEAERLEDFPLHILADIDQTVFVGTFGAGGPKFPTGPVPGALALFRALGGRVTFLSARPPIWEGQTRRLLDEIGIAEAVVLPGSLKAIAQVLYAPEQAKVAMAERKTEVFGQFATLHPEAQFIFIGDSGEGDIDFAEEFMAASRTRNLRRPPRAALIHDVARADGIVPKSNAARRNELRMRGIHVFDTYAGAALELFMLGLLDGEGLRQSAHGCLEEFGEIDVVEFASNEVFETRRMELLRDVREVNAAMRSAEQWRLRSGSAAGACVREVWRRNFGDHGNENEQDREGGVAKTLATQSRSDMNGFLKGELSKVNPLRGTGGWRSAERINTLGPPSHRWRTQRLGRTRVGGKGEGTVTTRPVDQSLSLKRPRAAQSASKL